MSEFEKELDVKIKSGEIMKERYKTGCILSHFVNLKDIESTFKDWQPPKPPVVVPQFFADWFENQLKNNESKKFDGNDVFRIIQDVIKISNDESTWEDYGITDEIAKFAEDNEELFLNLIVNCSLGNGYTVEKEKKYILKHIDLSKLSTDDSLYLAHSNFAKLQHVRYLKDVCMSKIKQCHFTQSEIDKLNVGSYEQIEVKVEEVE